jgi:bifunctional non-homologous end joining protein LigD
LTKRGWTEAAFVAFDLLRLNGEDLRQQPLEKRREALMWLVAKRRGDGIVFSDALEADGVLVFAKACEMGLEGIVSKREGSLERTPRCPAVVQSSTCSDSVKASSTSTPR